MQFSSPANLQGLVQDTLFMTRTTTASYPLAEITRNINQEYHNITRLIWESADGWEYDDSNKTDFPISTTTLVHNQQDYSIPSTAQRIQRVEVEDIHENWVKLNQIDQHDISIALEEYLDTPGLPRHYDLVGNSVVLYPTPSSAYCTLTSGLGIFYDRDITEFTTASTTATPGFATPFHRILSLQAAIDFGEDTGKIQLWMAEKDNLVKGLKKFYGSRNIEVRSSIRPYNKKYFRQYE